MGPAMERAQKAAMTVKFVLNASVCDRTVVDNLPVVFTGKSIREMSGKHDTTEMPATELDDARRHYRIQLPELQEVAKDPFSICGSARDV